jgi:hypothetical protein
MERWQPTYAAEAEQRHSSRLRQICGHSPGRRWSVLEKPRDDAGRKCWPLRPLLPGSGIGLFQASGVCEFISLLLVEFMS